MMEGVLEKCYSCGKKLHNGKASPVLERENCIVVIQDVPAWRCRYCGDAYFPETISMAMARIADDINETQEGKILVTFSDYSSETLESWAEECERRQKMEFELVIPVYPEPLASLLTCGYAATSSNVEDWIDYVQQYGFTEAHIPDLVRMALDDQIRNLTSRHDACWAYIHAYRVLGQLNAVDTAEDLLTLLEKDLDNDWTTEDIPHILARFGITLLPLIQSRLADSTKEEYMRGVLVGVIEKMVQYYPEYREQCITVLLNQLEKYETETRELNGLMVGAFIDWKWLPAVPAIERIHALDAVDETICGTLEDVLVDMGAKEPSPEYLAEKEKKEAEALAHLARIRELLREGAFYEKQAKRIHLQLARKLKAQKKKVKKARKLNKRK